MKKILCKLGFHDWEAFKDALDWETEEPSPYRMCYRCDKMENI